MWTLFWDMHSGGGSKEGKWDKIYIESESEDQAVVIFYNRFGHNPNRVSCTCCGEDYSISSEKDFAQASAYHRGCVSLKSKTYKSGQKKGMYKPFPDGVKLYYEKNESPPEGYELDMKYRSWDKYQTVAQYKKNEDVLVIPKREIKAAEKVGDVPKEGYVWM